MLEVKNLFVFGVIMDTFEYKTWFRPFGGDPS